MAEPRHRKFYGWGFEGQELDGAERARLLAAFQRHHPGVSPTAIDPPRIEDFDLAKPRLSAPDHLAHLVSAAPADRLGHAFGKSLPDSIRMFLRDVPAPPDLVAYPETEDDVVRLLDWLADAGAAAIPYGGGTSVCGGVECDVGDGYAGAVSIDLGRLDRILEIDTTSRAARIQAGITGPALEAGLKPHGLTLRHFPQSFELTTLGGWIATRSGGHYASLYTHIDDFVESTRLVTPAGILESARLPGSGAGPSPDRLVIGSEGILGLITEAWMRLQDRPTFRASAAVRFGDLEAGAAAVRALAQSALFPTNCRLLDNQEAANTGAGDGSFALLVLGFESADHPLDAWMARALELVADHGGQFDRDAVARSLAGGQSDTAEHRQGAAGQWRNAFIRMPYAREVLTGLGVISDTFETTITWDRFAAFHDQVKAEMAAAIQRITGRPGALTCRFTHVYPDGPAPYYTFQVLATETGDLRAMLAQWVEIKRAATDVVTRLGGTVTHHHAVGRDHRPGYEVQTAPLFRRALAAAKQALDPTGILNPGVLIDPVGRPVGVTGAMAN